MDSQFASVYKYIYTFIYIYTAYTTYTTYTKACRWQWLKSWSGVGSFVCHSLHLVTFPLCKCRWLFVLHKVEARLLAEHLFFFFGLQESHFLAGSVNAPQDASQLVSSAWQSYDISDKYWRHKTLFISADGQALRHA